jgi:hypothetical protein
LKGTDEAPASERAAAIRLVKEHVKEGDTLYTIVTKVNSMNSARWMRVLDIKDGSPAIGNYYVSKALGYKLKDDGTIMLRVAAWTWATTWCRL